MNNFERLNITTYIIFHLNPKSNYNMKKVIYLALLLTVSFAQCACVGNTKASTGSATENKASITNDDFREILLNSNFPFPTDIPKDKIQIEIDSQKNGTYLCRVYFETNGTGTLGWIKYDSVNKKLYNVTNEDPVELDFEKDASDERSSILPFSFDKYFEEYLSKGEEEISEEDKMKYHEYNFDENNELQQVFSSKWKYTPSTYMILDKKDNFTFYFFRASKQEENDSVLISILATVKGNNLIASLNMNDFDTANASSTFDISKELVISIYKTLTKETGEFDDNGPICISTRGSLIKEYVVDLNGNILQKPK